jgi:hypothetical protein
MAIIDSLFHNYYIPPVVFAISKDPVDGAVTRLCVDGKQRLTSIQKFFDGQVCHAHPARYRNYLTPCAGSDRMYGLSPTLTSIKYLIPILPDRCPRTKKLWWYTTTTATRGSRSEIPAFEKRVFAQKVITCSAWPPPRNTHAPNQPSSAQSSITTSPPLRSAKSSNACSSA